MKLFDLGLRLHATLIFSPITLDFCIETNEASCNVKCFFKHYFLGIFAFIA